MRLDLKIVLMYAAAILTAIVVYRVYAYTMYSPWRIPIVKARDALHRGKFSAVLDVRTKAERDLLGEYPGSVHIPSADLVTQMPRVFPDKDTTILIYCNTGQRARRAADILHELGYKNAYYITGSHLALL